MSWRRQAFEVLLDGDGDVEITLNYQDLDTAEEDLSISVFWSINYEPLTGFNELTLPSDRTSAGDEISFYYEVFDGDHRARSETVDITIEERRF